MSWLSSWLDRQGGVGRAINAVGGPIVNLGGRVAGEIPGVGTVVRAGQALGGLIPGGPSQRPQSVSGMQGGGIGGAIGGALGAAGNFLGGNGGLNALGLAQGANAAMLGQKASNFADMAAKNVDENFQSRAPLRVAGMEGMLRPQIADTSALRRISARGNPFADRPQPASGGR